MKEIEVTSRDGLVIFGMVVVFGLTLGGAVSDGSAVVTRVWLDAMFLVAPFWIGAAGWGWFLRMLLHPLPLGEGRVRAENPKSNHLLSISSGKSGPHPSPLPRGEGAGVVVQPVIGAAFLLMLDWLLAWAGWLNIVTAWSLCGTGAVLLVVQCLQPETRRRLASIRIHPHWAWILFAPSLALFAVAAACPPGSVWRVEAFGYDVLSYHLQLPREWLEAGAMIPTPHNVYGYFPNLMEVGFLQLAAMRGSMHEAIFAAQWLHVSMALLAAITLAKVVSERFGDTAGWIAGAALLATPWSLIVGSSAYNEMLSVSLAAGALLLVMDRNGGTTRGALTAGMLLGAATMAKLTAGPMLVVPIALVVLLQPWLSVQAFRPSWRQAIALTCCLALGGTLMLAPYFIRNVTWTGNPVFPFAADLFGRGHWSEQQARTWHDVHAAKNDSADRLHHLAWFWFLNPGYGGIDGAAATPDTYSIDRFHRTGGPSLLWIAALFGAAGLVMRPATRSFALLMLLMLVLQLIFWLFGTKQAPRYAFFTLLPGCALAGAAIGTLERFAWRSLAPVLGIALVASLSVGSFDIFFHQTYAEMTKTGPQPLPPRELIGVLPDDHIINRLPVTTRTYMVGDATAFYVRRPVAYFSAWDVGSLSGWLTEAKGDANLVTKRLRDAGFTHVWVHWTELRRIHDTIGTHDGIDAVTLRRTASHWRLIEDHSPYAGLYALP